jgi:hypothetical protein
MAPEIPPQHRPPRQSPLAAFQVIVVMLGLVVLPAALTLQTVHHPGRLEMTSANPTPLGYTISLALFVVPVSVLLGWLCHRRDLNLQRRACVRTLAVLVPLGVVLDLVFGNAFFTFPNPAATLGIGLPAVGGPIPLEEVLFYLSGFGVVLLTYVWADEYWMAAYNIPDYAAATAGIPRLVQFHWPSLACGIGLLVAALLYKKLWSPVPTGFPAYATYLIVAAFVPSAGFFRTAQPFINWRAFSFTCFFMLRYPHPRQHGGPRPWRGASAPRRRPALHPGGSHPRCGAVPDRRACRCRGPTGIAWGDLGRARGARLGADHPGVGRTGGTKDEVEYHGLGVDPVRSPASRARLVGPG